MAADTRGSVSYTHLDVYKRQHADASLVVSAHDPAPHVEHVLYRSSLQSLLDFVFVLLCQHNPDRYRQLNINLERVQHMLES